MRLITIAVAFLRMIIASECDEEITIDLSERKKRLIKKFDGISDSESYSSSIDSEAMIRIQEVIKDIGEKPQQLIKEFLEIRNRDMDYESMIADKQKIMETFLNDASEQDMVNIENLIKSINECFEEGDGSIESNDLLEIKDFLVRMRQVKLIHEVESGSH